MKKYILIGQEQFLKIITLLSGSSEEEKLEILEKAEVFSEERKFIYLRDIERAIEDYSK